MIKILFFGGYVGKGRFKYKGKGIYMQVRGVIILFFPK